MGDLQQLDPPLDLQPLDLPLLLPLLQPLLLPLPLPLLPPLLPPLPLPLLPLQRQRPILLDLQDLLGLLDLLDLQLSSTALRVSAMMEKEATELALPLCLFLPFSCLQSLPTFCSMFA